MIEWGCCRLGSVGFLCFSFGGWDLGLVFGLLVWGLFFGLVLVLEKTLLKPIIKKMPVIIRHLYVLLIILFSFVIFHRESMIEIQECLFGMIGLLDIPLANMESLYYIRSYAVILLAAMVGSTPLFRTMAVKLTQDVHLETGKCAPSQSCPKLRLGFAADAIQPVFCVVMLLLVTAYLVDSSFNPFLYFRF